MNLKSKKSGPANFHFLTVGFIGVMLMICGFIGFTLSHLLFEDIYSFTSTIAVAILFGAGLIIFAVTKYMSNPGRRKNRHIIELDAANVSHFSESKSELPSIDAQTALIVPIPQGYNHGLWILVVIEFCLLSIIIYFGLAQLDHHKMNNIVYNLLVSGNIITWFLGGLITIMPIMFLVWMRGRQLRKFASKTAGQELVLDKHGVRMALHLLPTPLQEAMIRDHIPFIMIPWRHIRAWSVQEEGDFSGESGHKFYVAPFPATHLKSVDQLRLCDIKILSIPMLYTTHVRHEILDMVKKYGPPVVERITEDF